MPGEGPRQRNPNPLATGLGCHRTGGADADVASEVGQWMKSKSLHISCLEARAGIEPAHKGFADLSLTTWVPRLGRAALKIVEARPNCRSQPGNPEGSWSGRRDLNSRPSPWQGDALPLSYSRLSQA